MPLIILVVVVLAVVVAVAVLKAKGGRSKDAGFLVDLDERIGASGATRPVQATAVEPTTADSHRDDTGPAPSPTPTSSVDAAPDASTPDRVEPATPPEDEPVPEPDLARFGVAESRDRAPLEIPWPSSTHVAPHHPMEEASSLAGTTDPDAVASDPSGVDGADTAEDVDDGQTASDAGPPAADADAAAAAAEVEPVTEVAVDDLEVDDLEVDDLEVEAVEVEAVEVEAVEQVVVEASVEPAAEATDAATASTGDGVEPAVPGSSEPVDAAPSEPEVVEQDATGQDGPDGDEPGRATDGDTSTEAADEGAVAEAVDGSDDDDTVIDLVATEAAQLQPEPEDPVDQVLNALINRARERHVGVAEVAAELVEQAALEDREVDEVLADLVGRTDEDGEVRTADRLSELTLFNDAVPRRPGELSQFERLGGSEKKRVIIRVLCLLVAQSGDRLKPREPRSDAETRSWPLARAIWPVPVEPVAEDPDPDLPARPVARSGRAAG